MSLSFSPRRTAAALLVVAVAGAAAAQAAGTTAPRPATGTAGSKITLLDLSVAGHPVSIGRLTLSSAMGTGKASVTGLIADGTPYGDRTITTGSTSTPSLSSAGLLPGPVGTLVSVVAPAASLSAGSGIAHAGTSSLGKVSLLGLPLAIDGTAAVDTGVDGDHAGASKTLVVRNLALPSVGGLLTSLGLDISKLPADVLSQLVTKLGLVTTTITSAQVTLDAALAPLQTQIAAAQQQVATAQAAVAAANAQVTTTTAALSTASSTLDSATQQMQAALGTAPHLVRTAALALPTVDPAALPAALPTVAPTAVPTIAPTAVSTVLPTALATSQPSVLPTSLPTALPSVLPSALPVPSLPAVIPVSTQPLVDTYNAAKAAYDAALAQVNTATGALNLANGVLNTASSALNTILSTVAGQTSALVNAITSVLDGTPLVSIDSFTVRTDAVVTSATTGGQTARVAGGELQGVHVLGTDVLQKAINSDRVDLGQLAGTPSALLNTAISTVTSTLSSVLSAVPGLTVPTPVVELLTSSSATDIAGGLGTATNTVHALKVTVPGLTIPTALRAPLAGLSVQALGDLVTSPLSIAVGTMTDTASFRPAVATNTGVVPPSPTVGAPTGSTPTGSTPTGSAPTGSIPSDLAPTTGSTPNTAPNAAGPGQQLPRTGLPAGLGFLAAGLVGAGLILRWRTAAL